MGKFRWKIAQFAEANWWQIYLKSKPMGDYLQWKSNYWSEFLRQIDVSPKPGSTALDAGSGPAGVFINLHGLQVDAVDPLINHYDENLEHFKKENYPFVSFFPVPLEEFRPEKAYDTVFCIHAINHVHDLEACLDKLDSCLGHGGELVISVDTHNFRFFKYLFRTMQCDILHPHQYDLPEYREMFEKRGFEIIKEVRCGERFFFDYYILVCRKLEAASDKNVKVV